MKKLIMVLASMLMVASLVGCSDQKEEVKPTDESETVVETEGTETPETEKEETVNTDEKFTFEGEVEEKRDLTITVTEGEEAYIFDLPEGFETEAEAGSKVKVTYTGNKDDIDSRLEVVSIEVIE